MKRQFIRLILVTLVSLIALFSISTALGTPTSVPIGGTTQLYPFESQPQAVEAGSLSVSGSAATYDGNIDSGTGNIPYATGYFGLTDFKRPSDVGKTEFSIGSVDFKMKYTSKGSADDEYRILFYVGSAGPVVLKDWVSGTTTLAKMDMGAYTLAETWGNQSEPEDSTWTWSEIENIRFRFEIQVVSSADPPFMYWSNIFEVWLSVYPTAPPVASTTISVMPTTIEPLGLYEYIFVDLYVANVSRLQVYEAELNYDPAVLYAMDAWHYWPFTAEIYKDFTTPGKVGLGYYISTTIPIVDAGYNGTYPIARIYFAVLDAAGYSWLTYTMTKLIAPAGLYMPHMNWHGVYGTPPATSHLLQWKSLSEFPWADPVCTDWVEIYPLAGREWHLSSVEEPWDPPLKASDQIDMTSPEHPGEVWWFHVDEIWEILHDPTPGAPDPYSVTMILSFKYKEVPEFPLGVGLMMMLAPAIPIVYLWRTRKKVLKR